MSVSGMVEILRLQAKSRFVMPAKAGIHLGSLQGTNTRIDSGVRRNDGYEIRLGGDTKAIPHLQPRLG